MKAKRTLLCICGLVFGFACAFTVFSADEDLGEKIEELKAKTADIKSYSADLQMDMEMMGRKMTSSGSMFFKAPDNLNMELQTDMGAMKMKQITISNGETTWTYQPQLNMVSKIDLSKVKAATEEDSPAINAGADLTNPLATLNDSSISLLRTDEVNGKKVYVFEGVPKAPTSTTKVPFMPEKMQLWIGVEDGLPRKMIFFNDKGEEMMSQQYSNIKTNIEIPDSKFKFDVPESAQVMDMTQGTINMIKSMQDKQQE